MYLLCGDNLIKSLTLHFHLAGKLRGENRAGKHKKVVETVKEGVK